MYHQYAKGGKFENENADMLKNQVQNLLHHANELSELMSNSMDIEPWVITKAQRAVTDLADITHYLEGERDVKKEYAEGGQIALFGYADGGRMQTKPKFFIEDAHGNTFYLHFDAKNERNEIRFDKDPARIYMYDSREEADAVKRKLEQYGYAGLFVNSNFKEQGGMMADGGEVSHYFLYCSYDPTVINKKSLQNIIGKYTQDWDTKWYDENWEEFNVYGLSRQSAEKLAKQLKDKGVDDIEIVNIRPYLLYDIDGGYLEKPWYEGQKPEDIESFYGMWYNSMEFDTYEEARNWARLLEKKGIPVGIKQIYKYPYGVKMARGGNIDDGERGEAIMILHLKGGFIAIKSSEGKNMYRWKAKKGDWVKIWEYLHSFGLEMADGGMMDDEDDEYGTFEMMKRGGNVEVEIVNKEDRFDEERYEWMLEDFDKDGVPNADDSSPLNKRDANKVDNPGLSKAMTYLLDLKGKMDDNMYSFVDDLKDIAPDGSKIYARTKTPYSILNKLVTKRLMHPKSGLTDLIGTTITTSTKEELDAVKDQINSGELGKVIEFEDMYENPKQGYRAYHFLVERNGMPVEVQLKTKRQKAINQISHEAYKEGRLDGDKLLHISEVADKADLGDAEAIKEYQEFMSQPDVKQAFYMEKGGSITDGIRLGGDLRGHMIKDIEFSPYILEGKDWYAPGLYEVKFDLYEKGLEEWSGTTPNKLIKPAGWVLEGSYSAIIDGNIAEYANSNLIYDSEFDTQIIYNLLPVEFGDLPILDMALYKALKVWLSENKDKSAIKVKGKQKRELATDPNSWNVKYKVGDKVKLRPTEKTKYPSLLPEDPDIVYEITKVNPDYFRNTKYNKKGTAYTIESDGYSDEVSGIQIEYAEVESKKMAKGGITYPSLSDEEPMIVQDSKVKKKADGTDYLPEIKIILENDDRLPADKRIFSSNDAYNAFWRIWDQQSINVNESMYVLFLKQNNKPKGYSFHSKGAISATTIDPAIIAAQALKSLSKGIIVAHNHPSGSTEPSRADIEMANKLREGLALYGIQMLDSLILTPTYGKFRSMEDEGDLTISNRRWESGGKMPTGGRTSFLKLAKTIAKKYEGKPVKPEWQEKYGKRYDKEEAMKVGNATAAVIERRKGMM